MTSNSSTLPARANRRTVFRSSRSDREMPLTGSADTLDGLGEAAETVALRGGQQYAAPTVVSPATRDIVGLSGAVSYCRLAGRYIQAGSAKSLAGMSTSTRWKTSGPMRLG